MSKLIDPSDLSEGWQGRTPSGNLLNRTEYINHPDRILSVPERVEGVISAMAADKARKEQQEQKKQEQEQEQQAASGQQAKRSSSGSKTRRSSSNIKPMSVLDVDEGKSTQQQTEGCRCGCCMM